MPIENLRIMFRKGRSIWREVYGYADCSGCEHKARCLYKYNAEKDAEKNKVMKSNEQWEKQRQNKFHRLFQLLLGMPKGGIN